MRLYLVQHGLARSKAEDPERPLTEEGMLQVAKMAALLKPLGLSTAAIWHSGKTRAEQTAELLTDTFSPEEGLIHKIGLAPNDAAPPMAEAISKATGDIVIVGHLPMLAKLASYLLAGNEKGKVVSFTNAGVVCLERDDAETWSLAWAMVPELLP